MPAASYLDDQEKIWQRYRIKHHLSALLKRKEDARMARPHHTLDKLPLQTLEPLSTICLTCGNAAQTVLQKES